MPGEVECATAIKLKKIALRESSWVIILCQSVMLNASDEKRSRVQVEFFLFLLFGGARKRGGRPRQRAVGAQFLKFFDI